MKKGNTFAVPIIVLSIRMCKLLIFFEKGICGVFRRSKFTWLRTNQKMLNYLK